MKVKGYKAGQPSVSIPVPFRAQGVSAAGSLPGEAGAFFRLDGRRVAPSMRGGAVVVPALTLGGAAE
jgi:hypothetical protein